MIRAHGLFVALLAAATAMAPASAHAAGQDGAGTVRVWVPNTRAVRGTIHVDVCPAGDFLKPCPYSAQARVKMGGTEIIVRDIPPGLYAIQLFHDENGNGKVDRGLFGIPKEGVGFSNNYRISTHAPRFKDARFMVGAGETRMTISLQYF